MSKLRVLDPVFSDSFETALRRFFTPIAFETDPQGLKMRVDLSEKDDAYQVKADIPGVKKEDINVSVDGKVVCIKAHSQSASEKKNGKVLFNERHYGEISRTFTLDQEIDDSKAKGKYADGVLTLELPKKAEQPKLESKPIAIQ